MHPLPHKLWTSFFLCTGAILVFGMAQLLACDKRLLVAALIPFCDVYSVLRLASACRHFRSLLRQELVWRILYVRDLPYLAADFAQSLAKEMTAVAEKALAVEAPVA